MKDLQGRKYATIADTKEGDLVEVDGDFTCMHEGEVKKVHKDTDGDLYIECSEGIHLLDGQIKDDYYIGIYPKE